jgi:hypothetical protein
MLLEPFTRFNKSGRGSVSHLGYLSSVATICIEHQVLGVQPGVEPACLLLFQSFEET